jgi:hypothetical protein
MRDITQPPSTTEDGATGTESSSTYKRCTQLKGAHFPRSKNSELLVSGGSGPPLEERKPPENPEAVIQTGPGFPGAIAGCFTRRAARKERVDAMADVQAALGMVDAFADLGVTHFDLSVVEDLLGNDGRGYSRRVADRQLANAHVREIRFKLANILREADAKHYSVILRPRPIPSVLMIQLDDLDERKVTSIRPYVFLVVRTSPGNYQGWIAVKDAPEDKDQCALFARRLRRGVGADDSASGAGRISGSYNFKRKYAPTFPPVEIVHRYRREVNCSELDDTGMLLPESPQTISVPATPGVPSKPKRKRGWPDYAEVLRGAPLRSDGSGRDRSRSDALWCKWASQRGYSVEEIAAKLSEVSERAREKLAHGDTTYALEKARWGDKVAGN